MALKVWIGENLDRRHEQEQMKEFLSLMHSVYDNQPGQCHVLCNFICGGSQIDAAVVKRDAFIVVEFKSANGIVSGAENGKWSFEDFDTCRRVEMKGGAHATNPYSQVANARTAVASKLETSESVFFHKNECDRIADWRHFVHGLVLLEPDLADGATDEIGVDFHTKPWFSCCRMKDVSETIYRTTTRDGDLSNKNILKIIEQVLHLEKAEMRDGVPMMPNSEDDNEPKQEIEKPVVPEPAKFQQTIGDVAKVKTMQSAIKKTLSKTKPSKAVAKMPSPEIPLTTPVMRSAVKLPEWLDALIYQELGAEYHKECCNMIVLEWTRPQIRKYLGTYFPRTYVEAYCLFSDYFKEHRDRYAGKDSLSILDFGCGTGGGVLGLLAAAAEQLPSLTEIKVKAFDGNKPALQTCERLVVALEKHWQGKRISVSVFQDKIEDESDLHDAIDVLKGDFDVIISFKAIGEMVAKRLFGEKNPYEVVLRAWMPKLNTDGIACLADVAVKVEGSWLPKLLDDGIATAAVRVASRNSDFSETFFVTHSRAKNDTSKIAWRILTKGNTK